MTSCLLLLVGCSTKQNTRASRKYFAFTTRFNVYFNGIDHYNTTLKAMEEEYPDNYTRLLHMHPVSAYNLPKESQNSARFDRTIEKCEKAIRTRSIKTKPKRDRKRMSDPKYKEFVNREEFNPYLHNAWVLLGKAQFYNGDFLAASSTFAYTARHFTWLPDVVAHSQLWLARCYVELGWLYEAEDILTKINNEGLPDSQSDWFAAVNASYLIQLKRYTEAIPYLKQAIAGEKSKAQRHRMSFLLAQLYVEVGDKGAAYSAFGEIIAMNPPYRTEFNARIKQTEVSTGEHTESMEKRLNKMVYDPKNKEYLDQVYYALGNLYLHQNDTINALKNYHLAVDKSVNNGVERAITQVQLGDIYFKQKLYTKAQPCYTEALPLIDESYPNYAVIERRSEVLDNLVVYSQNVELQDSLQLLAAMSEEDRNAKIQLIIDALIAEEKAAEEEELLAQNQEQQQAASDLLNQNGGAKPPSATVNTNGDNSWYFYNKALVNAGKIEFQRKWGSRKLEDNWRRRNKAELAMASEPEAYDYSEEERVAEGDSLATTVEGDSLPQPAQDPKSLAYYIQQLPLTPEAITSSNEIIGDGLYNMGVILKNELEDFTSASEILGRLVGQYADSEFCLEAYHNLYLMAMQEGDVARAEEYQRQIIALFPTSSLAIAMSDKNYLNNLLTMESRQDSIYNLTYSAYLENRGGVVHDHYQYMQENYPLSRLMPKFMFLDALSYVGEEQPEQFKEGLNTLIEQYPLSDVSPLSSEMLKRLAEGKEVSRNAGNMKGLAWDDRLSTTPMDSAALANDSTVQPFTYDLNAPHLLLVAYPTDSVNNNELLFKVARYNFTNFMIKDFDLEIMSFNTLSMLVIKGFNNFDELDQYMALTHGEEGIAFPTLSRLIEISEDNFKRLLEGYSFEAYFEFIKNKQDEK